MSAKGFDLDASNARMEQYLRELLALIDQAALQRLRRLCEGWLSRPPTIAQMGTVKPLPHGSTG
ncbi:MAG: hypothetical protein M1319_00040 [Chloroflexi bacterium]|nr:hypothetical protein [Chloroflexota bacterium]